MTDVAGNSVEAVVNRLRDFTERVRREAIRYLEPAGHAASLSRSPKEPIQEAYEVCVGKLSDGDRAELVRIIEKMSSDLREGRH